MTPSSAAFAHQASSPRPRHLCESIPTPASTRCAPGSVATCVGAARMLACYSPWQTRPAGKEELLNMLKVDWPPAEKRTLIGKRIDRADGPAKTTGTAKYSYDINRPGMLYAKLVTSPYANAEIESIDLRAA